MPPPEVVAPVWVRSRFADTVIPPEPAVTEPAMVTSRRAPLAEMETSPAVPEKTWEPASRPALPLLTSRSTTPLLAPPRASTNPVPSTDRLPVPVTRRSAFPPLVSTSPERSNAVSPLSVTEPPPPEVMDERAPTLRMLPVERRSTAPVPAPPEASTSPLMASVPAPT